MSRSKNVLVSILAIAIFSSVNVGIVESAEVRTAKFANCEKLLKKYKFGVAVSKSKKGSSKAIVSGTVFLGRGFSFESKDVKYLEIDADGTWSAKVAPASSAPSFTGVASGSGDVVLRYGGSKTIVSLTHDGSSNFAVTTYDNKGLYGDLVANEIGAYKGRVVLPAAEYIVIEADGNWTISK